MGQSFEILSPKERVQAYWEMADATFLKAQKVEDSFLRTRYLTMASSWQLLARKLEAGISDLALIPADQTAGPEQRAGTD